jgi:2-polyprenyl-6-methoxyphenol hydroxylase-like FAD-dependent oxidoreductase
VKPLIIGAGIAGLTLGISLRHRGMEAEICEAAPELHPIGAGIWMAPNAMRVFGRLGLAQPIIEAGAEVERVALLDSNLREISSSSLARAREKFGYAIVAIERAELHRILFDGFGSGCLHLGKRLVSIDNHFAAPTAVFEDGISLSAPFVIGADGIHSTARKLIRPSAQPRRTGQLCWRGLTNFDLPREFRRSTVEIWSATSRMGIADIGHGRAYWFLVSSRIEAARPRPSDPTAELLEIVKEYAGPSRDLIRATPGSVISEIELTDLPPRLPWSAGNVCLIGDAAHPTTPNMGQGGAQAVEDGWILARCLAEYREPAQAFHAFETARFKKVKSVVNSSSRFGAFVHSGWPRLRNFLFRLAPERLTMAAMERLYRLDSLA